MSTRPGSQHLAPTRFIDSDQPAVVEFAQRHARGGDARERAVALALAVRDGFRYDPYQIDLTAAGMCASSVLARGHGWCVTKAVLLAAAARAAGIPARLGFADVRNHLSTERMRRLMQTDVFHWHGYAELWLDDSWRKATPAFNIELCKRFGLVPLDFNGVDDSIYHAFDQAGHRHMEYVLQRGSYDDLPLDALRADLALAYPSLLAPGAALPAANFDHDVRAETAAATGTAARADGH
jgi:transglutaminase-like putative cysteine protease